MGAANKNRSKATTPALAAAGGILIGPAFLVLAGVFIVTSNGPALPTAASPVVPVADLVPGSIRTPLKDPPTVVIAGYTQRCNACHKLFSTFPHTGRQLVQHRDIVLDHGMNDQCLNCHDTKNRERLLLHDGSTIAYADSPLLCAQCHGLVYRDWQRGTHGNTLGYWNKKFGQPRRQVCVACHDPHSPQFPLMKPYPGPHTLRMGDASGHDAGRERERHNPLSLRNTLERATGDERTAPGTKEGY